MSSEWPVLPLENCLDALIDYRGKTPVKTDRGIPLVTAKIIKSGRIETPTEFIAIDSYDDWMRRGIPKPGDVVLTVEAPLGEVAQLGPEKVALAQRVVTLRGRSGVLDSTYLLYLLQSEEIQEQLKSRATGTTVIGIKQSELRKVPIKVPPFSIQIAVSAILKALDDQITLLRETNETLEAIAQAIFKSWFVDFDPVKAKAAGLVPAGIDEATAAMFPDSFEESALGLVPQNWSITTLADHVVADRGLSYKGAGLCGAEEGIPMHNLNSVLEGGGYKYAGLKFYKGDYKDRHLISAGEIIVANTEQGHDHKLIGFPALVPECYPKGILSHHLYRVRIREESWLTRQFIFYTLMANAVREQIISCANGSTVNMLKSAGLEIPKFSCPPVEILKAFDSIVTPIRSSIEANVQEIKTLSELRDTLLPRLISGKLRIPETQEAVEEMA